MKKYLSFGISLLGTAALLYCILLEVDGIGRAALIVFGVAAVLAGWVAKPKL